MYKLASWNFSKRNVSSALSLSKFPAITKGHRSIISAIEYLDHKSSNIFKKIPTMTKQNSRTSMAMIKKITTYICILNSTLPYLKKMTV